jgi:hypothetical protein
VLVVEVGTAGKAIVAIAHWSPYLCEDVNEPTLPGSRSDSHPLAGSGSLIRVDTVSARRAK